MSIRPVRSYDDIMREVESKEGNMIRKVLIYKSPITEDWEYRVAYFTSAAEACIWEGEMSNKYQKMNITHQIYTNLVYMTKGAPMR